MRKAQKKNSKEKVRNFKKQKNNKKKNQNYLKQGWINKKKSSVIFRRWAILQFLRIHGLFHNIQKGPRAYSEF